MSDERISPEEAQDINPDEAMSERAGETPPTADAEELEAALRQGDGALDSGEQLEQPKQRTAPDPGGTSLT